MYTDITFPHTYESGITIIKESARGAYLISDGINVAWIIRNWIREDGTLTNCGMKALMDSSKTVDDLAAEKRAWEEKKAAEKRAWEEKKAEGSKKVTYVLEKGVLLAASTTAYKYACGKGYDMYRHLCTRWSYIPKSQLTVERKNNKVYVTLPKWLAEKNSTIFNTIA